MAITAQDVNKLRKQTGAGMMDCKKALTEANGDFEDAIAFLRKKGQKVSASRADRETTEGRVFVKTVNDGKTAYLVSLGCETDFVAKNDDFVALGESFLNAAVEAGASSPEELMAATIGGQSVAEVVIENIGKIGEKLDIANVIKMEGETVVPYIHSNAKLGVLVSLKGGGDTAVEEIGKDVAMQIAAMNPLALDKSEIAQSVIDRELEVGMEQARAEGKPEAMLEKIANGKLNKFFSENTLLSQKFVKDNKKSITQVLNDVNKGLTVTEFKRITLG
jgi:elongation factor Ts